MELEIAKAKKKRQTAALILAAVVILGTVFGCLRSVSAQRNTVLNEFNRDVGIATDLNTRYDSSYDLVTVAYRYLDTDDPAVTAVLEARNVMENAKTTEEKYAANLQLTEATAALDDKMQTSGLSDKDEGYRGAIMAELESRNSTISHDPYNDLARKFNEKVLGAFPASVITSLFNVSKLAVFR